jgi:CRP/FNR family transcriptional regulator, cyclic AMP receptor protein
MTDSADRRVLDACTDLPRRTVTPGDLVIEQGDAPGPVYLLVSGSVLVERNGVVLARVSEAGAMFGEMSTLMSCPATASVRAEGACDFLVAQDGAELLATRSEVTLSIARMLAARLDLLSGYLAEVKRQFAGQAGHLGMLDEMLESLMNQQPRQVRPGSSRMPEVDY